MFFEQAVLDLLIAKGYGGAEGSATRTQLSPTAPPTNIVGRTAIQAFVGALAGNQASQGLVNTTSRVQRRC